MKAEIIGYITGTINNHNRILEGMKKRNCDGQIIQLRENCINELNDLLDYVEDIPEEPQPITVNFNSGNELKRIKELEESCEFNSKVITNLQKKIEGLTQRRGKVNE